ncbi:Na+/H+ antiporter subunit E [Nitrogeniibacter aestuarii]|uniref:Na+/H+ antiporter subunit E n=1 Tax=Nitrogeniibacter aestuarii TaxID=2815343 RepID=UPI001E40B0A9|nr:Na+/H+ antiporter subunit E [Nitrogeniibacter aestuarii]
MHWIRSLSIVLTLFAFWLVLSGYFIPFLLAMGVLSALAVVWFSHRMEVVDHEGHPIHLGPGALSYWPWLMWHIIADGLKVTRIILDPKLPISPTMVRIKTSQKSAVGQVVLANSITLTPGTLSVVIEGDEILVHALTKAGAEDVADGVMDARVSSFEGMQ